MGVWHRNLHCGAGVATDCEGLWAVGLVAIEALAVETIGSSWENVKQIIVYTVYTYVFQGKFGTNHSKNVDF